MKTPEPILGTVLGARYRIVRKLGEGAMSEVYLAEHVHIGRREAVKVLRPEMAQETTFVKRFRREARAINRVQHNNIIGIYDFGQLPDGRLYLAMEYADGPNLESILAKDQRLALPRALHVLHQLAGAVDHAHQKGVVHRDLKPGNLVLVEHRGHVDVLKVLDFGMAKITCSSENDQLTQRGELFGTPEYMAPESLSGATDPRSDIYAIGCIGYHLITGAPPFSGHRVQLLQQHMEAAPPPPSRRLPAPPLLDTIMLRCLEKDPEARYQNGAQLQRAIEQVPGYARSGATRRLWIAGSLGVEIHDEATHSESIDWARRQKEHSLAYADTAAATAGDSLSGVYEALLELAEQILDAGIDQQSLRLAVAQIRALSDDFAQLQGLRTELEQREARIEQSCREREGSLRFAIGELRFDREHSQAELPDDLDFQVRALEQRLDELLEETRTRLAAITDENVALVARQAQLDDGYRQSYAQLRGAVAESVSKMAPGDPSLAPLIERHQAISGALELITSA